MTFLYIIIVIEVSLIKSTEGIITIDFNPNKEHLPFISITFPKEQYEHNYILLNTYLPYSIIELPFSKFIQENLKGRTYIKLD